MPYVFFFSEAFTCCHERKAVFDLDTSRGVMDFLVQVRVEVFGVKGDAERKVLEMNSSWLSDSHTIYQSI